MTTQRVDIGLDLGNRMGISVWVDGELDYSKAWEWAKKGKTLEPKVRSRFRAELFTLVLAKMPDEPGQIRVAYERPHMRGYGATKSLMGWVTSVEEVCDALGVPVFNIHTGTLKRFATGRGKASKDDMIKAARKYKPGVEDDNEADAIMVGAWLVTTGGESLTGGSK